MSLNLSRYKPDIRQSLTLAYPVILSQLGHVTMGVADNVMVGHIGATELAAAGLANIAFSVLMLFGIGVSYAITPLVAEADAQNAHAKSGAILRHGLVVNMANALILCVVVYYGKNLLYVIDQPEDVVRLAIPYLEIITFSLIPIMIFQSFRQFSEGLSDTWTPMTIILGANVINILLNYILINGHLGFPALQLNGAGWATLISRTMMAGSIAAIIFFSKSFKAYRSGFTIGGYSWKLFRKLLKIGLPAGSQFIFEVAAFDFSLVMMGWLGTQALAAHQIAINLATISYMTTSGLASAATIRVSNELGRHDYAGLRRTAFLLVGLALVVMAGWGLIFIAGNKFLPGLYVNDPGVATIASSLIVIAGLFQLADGTQVVCIGALRGLHDVMIPSVLIFASYWIIGLPLGYWLGFKMGFGAQGIWIGLLIGLTLTATAMFLRLNHMTKRAMAKAALKLRG